MSVFFIESSNAPRYFAQQKRYRVTASGGSAFPFGRLLLGTNPKVDIMGYKPTRLLILPSCLGGNQPQVCVTFFAP
jgi:hypothetical protein